MEDLTLSGNEALAQGAYEAGIGLATGYPGTPATRFLSFLTEISSPEEIYTEWSANEKVALETALGFSMRGGRAAVCFKCVGLNVAMDPLMVANLGGVVGGLVLVLGDDPGAYVSQNEQDGRMLARAANIPVLEPSDPQEAYEMMKFAFALSEKYHVPVLVREVRAASIDRGKVEVAGGRHAQPFVRFAGAEDWHIMPVRQLDKHKELVAKLPLISEEFSSSPFNDVVDRGRQGVIGVGYTTRKLRSLLVLDKEIPLSFFKVGTVYPFPDKALVDFLRSVDEVMVAEDVLPLVEHAVASLANRHGVSVRVFGRETGHLPSYGDLHWEDIVRALKDAFGVKLPEDPVKEGEPSPAGIVVNPLLSPLPEECPYHQAFKAFITVLPDDPARRPIFVGDDGCLMRLQNDPFRMLDCKFCMGASLGVASGLARTGEDRRVIAVIGDSAFFHTGIPAYMSAAANGANILVIVLNNGTTAMTGYQSHPGSPLGIRGAEQSNVELDKLLRVPQLRHYFSLDAYGDAHVLASAFRTCLESDGMAVILVRGPCPFIESGARCK